MNSHSPSSKVVLVTGGSSGLGLAICRFLHQKGCTVYGTSRNPDKVDEEFHALRMDVTDEGSIRQGVEKVLEAEGRIDVLVNNAGLGFNGAVEDASTQEIKKVFDTNIHGLLSVTRAVLPSMRERKDGLIINISSIAGAFGLPFRGVYSASKHAVEAFSESLSMEVKPFGVNVVIVQPGDFKTSINENRAVAQSSPNSPYKKWFEPINDQIIEEVAHAGDPVEIGKAVWKIIQSRNPRLRYPVAKPLQKLSVKLHNLLPGRMFERILGNHYGLNSKKPSPND